MKMKSESEVTRSCPTLSDPMDCSLPGSSIHGIFQARALEWGAIAFSAITHWRYSNGGRVLDQNWEKKQEQVIKNIISWLQATPEPYKRLDLLSQLQPLLKPLSGNQHLTRLLNSSFQFFHYTQHTSQCWICMSLSPSPHSNSLTLNLAVTGQLYLPFPTKNYITHWASL